MLAAGLACAFSVLSTLSGHYNFRRGHAQCIMVQVDSGRMAA